MQRTVYKINPMPVSYLMGFIKKIKAVAKESNMKITSWIEEKNPGEEKLYSFKYPKRTYVTRCYEGFDNVTTTITIEG